jgi:hypothetical protein
LFRNIAVKLYLLVAEPIELFAVRAVPSDAVAGKVCVIDIHAGLADGKPAPAGPGKRSDLPAAMTFPVSSAAAAMPHAFRFVNHIAYVKLKGGENFFALR